MARSRRHRGERVGPGDLALAITCAECGRAIVLVAGEQCIVLADRDEFLSTHASCLDARPLDAASM